MSSRPSGMIRRKQTPISIRSDKAAARLKLLTSDGRSQAEVVEEALDMMEPNAAVKELWLRELQEIIDRIANGSIMSMKEFDALEYDENGDLRDR